MDKDDELAEAIRCAKWMLLAIALIFLGLVFS